MTIEKFPLRVKEKLQLCWQWNARSCAFWLLIYAGCDIYPYQMLFDYSALALEVVSKPQIRFKGKAPGRSGKRSIHWVCEHLPEACNAAIGP
jgi:hypothetical protein